MRGWSHSEKIENTLKMRPNLAREKNPFFKSMLLGDSEQIAPERTSIAETGHQDLVGRPHLDRSKWLYFRFLLRIDNPLCSYVWTALN